MTPPLVTRGVTTGLGTGIQGIATALSYFEALSNDLQESLDEIARSIAQVQGQTDSLVAIALQNKG